MGADAARQHRLVRRRRRPRSLQAAQRQPAATPPATSSCASSRGALRVAARSTDIARPHRRRRVRRAARSAATSARRTASWRACARRWTRRAWPACGADRREPRARVAAGVDVAREGARARGPRDVRAQALELRLVFGPLAPGWTCAAPCRSNCPMGKRIVVCCDGTWNTPDEMIQGVRTPTNVAKVALAVTRSDEQYCCTTSAASAPASGRACAAARSATACRATSATAIASSSTATSPVTSSTSSASAAAPTPRAARSG